MFGSILKGLGLAVVGVSGYVFAKFVFGSTGTCKGFDHVLFNTLVALDMDPVAAAIISEEDE